MLKAAIFAGLVLCLTTDAAHLRHETRHKRESSECPKECLSNPLEISFVVDASASIWPGNFTLGLNFIEDFVNIFEISQTAVRVSLVTYGEVVYDQDDFGFADYSNNQDLMEAISNIPYRSGIMTNTSGGIWHMLNKQMPEAREGVRRVVIVLTDGNSQETALTKRAAKDALDSGLEVFAIGVGHDVSPQELHNIASDDRHVFVVSAYHMLESIKKRLSYEACNIPTQPVCEMDPVDLSFVIDSSASIGEGNFSVGMQFVKEFVDSFQLNPSAVRVSLVTFGEVVYTEDAFGFDTYTDKKDVLDTLAGIKWRHGKETNTGAGIKYMQVTQMAKARPIAAHICIVITDGESQETEQTKEQAKAAQDAGIVMYAIGVGKIGEKLNEEELINIAGDTSRVLTAENYAQLNLLKDSLTDITCQGILQSIESKASKFRE
ncbi:cartilage matrix protein-like [Littorina saxatilis]|uniref:VWFA domain-containing protein n=1 Tax=Littorina saxatilis TaxID=31220 RepID=A0AAN9AJ14_9CAEN